MPTHYFSLIHYRLHYYLLYILVGTIYITVFNVYVYIYCNKRSQQSQRTFQWCDGWRWVGCRRYIISVTRTILEDSHVTISFILSLI